MKMLPTKFSISHVVEHFGYFTKDELLEKFRNREACETLRIDLGNSCPPLWSVLQQWRTPEPTKFIPLYTERQAGKRPPTMEELAQELPRE